MKLALADRIDMARSLRRTLVTRLGDDDVGSCVVHAPYDSDLTGYYPPDDDEIVSEDTTVPRLNAGVIHIDFLPSIILISWPKRARHGGRRASKEVAIEEGIGGRTVVDETDAQIVEYVVRKGADLTLAHRQASLRKVRTEIRSLRKREDEVLAEIEALKTDAALAAHKAEPIHEPSVV